MQKIMFNDRYRLTAAVLAGNKTMTRRCEFDESEQQVLSDADAIGYGQGCCQVWKNGRIEQQIPSRYKVGEVVAVAQAYKHCINDVLVAQKYKTDIAAMVFERSKGWTNKMFVRADLMPYRIRITDVRVERLQDISDEDCLKEGIWCDTADLEYQCYEFFGYNNNEDDDFDTPREAFASLIDKVSGKGTWERNLWVFAYEFELLK